MATGHKTSPFVIIGMPTYNNHVCHRTTASLDKLISATHGTGVSLAIPRGASSILPKQRNDLVWKMLEMQATHLLFIDSDMVFDGDFLLYLLDHNRDIVSGLCVSRGAPYTPVVRMKNKDGKYRPVDGLEDGRFIEDVDGVGMAFCLIKKRVFEKIEPPWFAMPPYGNEVQGEDYYFCEKAKLAGFQISVDCSLVVGHITDHPVTIYDYVNYKLEREKQEAAKKKKESLIIVP